MEHGHSPNVRIIEDGLVKIESWPEGEPKTSVLETIQGLIDFHSFCIDRMMELIAESGKQGYETFAKFADDEAVASLLLLYDLHPQPIEDRVAAAIETVRPALQLHSGGVELIGLEDGIVRLRLKGNCHGCPSSRATLRETVERAIFEIAPDVRRIEVEEDDASRPGFVNIERRQFTDCEFAAAATA